MTYKYKISILSCFENYRMSIGFQLIDVLVVNNRIENEQTHGRKWNSLLM